MARALIVRSAFGPYEAGAIIEDPETVAAIEAGENSGHVVPFNQPAPDAPAQEG